MKRGHTDTVSMAVDVAPCVVTVFTTVEGVTRHEHALLRRLGG